MMPQGAETPAPEQLYESKLMAPFYPDTTQSPEHVRYQAEKVNTLHKGLAVFGWWLNHYQNIPEQDKQGLHRVGKETMAMGSLSQDLQRLSLYQLFVDEQEKKDAAANLERINFDLDSFFQSKGIRWQPPKENPTPTTGDPEMDINSNLYDLGSVFHDLKNKLTPIEGLLDPRNLENDAGVEKANNGLLQGLHEARDVFAGISERFEDPNPQEVFTVGDLSGAINLNLLYFLKMINQGGRNLDRYDPTAINVYGRPPDESILDKQVVWSQKWILFLMNTMTDNLKQLYQKRDADDPSRKDDERYVRVRYQIISEQDEKNEPKEDNAMEYLYVSFQDNATGFSEEFLKDGGFKMGKSERGGGTGFGMAYQQEKLFHNYGGIFLLENVVVDGKVVGGKITVRLPIRPNKPESAPLANKD